jgi:hypothetical protein
MLKEKTIIVLYPEEMFQLNTILLDEDKEGAWDFLAKVIKRKVDEASKPHCRPVFEMDRGKNP